jgi:hypothetical protein
MSCLRAASVLSTQVVRQIVGPTGRVIITDADKKSGRDEEMVEKKITSKGGSFTLQTIRKSVSDDEDNDSQDGRDSRNVSKTTIIFRAISITRAGRRILVRTS